MAKENEGKLEVSSSKIEIDISPKENKLKNGFYLVCEKCENFFKEMMLQYPIVSKIVLGIVMFFVLFISILSAVN